MTMVSADPVSETVFVTGASRGLGRQLAAHFAARGARVIGAVRDREACHAQTGVELVDLDVASSASVASLEAKLDGVRIDILVNNAAIRGETGGLRQVEEDDFLEVMRVNALAPLLVTRALLPALKRGERKIVANISSRAGSLLEGTVGDDDGDYAYRCSKAALNMATRKLAHDLKASGITILSLHPGWVRTDMGGACADLPVEASASALIDLIQNASLRDTGSFRAFDGTNIAW